MEDKNDKKIQVYEQNISDLRNSKNPKMSYAGSLTGYASIDKPWRKYYSAYALNINAPNCSAYDLMKQSNIRNLDSYAINYYGNMITYRNMLDKIEKISIGLKNNGIEKGDIVSMCLPNFPEAIYTFYAINKLGAIANIMDVRLSENELKKSINEVNSKKIVIFDQCLESLSNIVDETPLDTIVSVSASDSLPYPARGVYNFSTIFHKDKIKNSFKFIKWNEFLNKYGKADNEQDKCKLSGDLSCAIIHTGGTTGIPKGVVLTNDNLNSMVYQYKYIGINYQNGQKFLNLVPPFIAYGLVNSLHMPLCLGLTEILIPKMNPKDFPTQMLKYKPNYVLATPVHWNELSENKKSQNINLSYLITAGVGGDVLTPTMENRINSFLKSHQCEYKLSKGYGMTEVSSCAVTCTNNDCNKLGSVGIPLPKNNIKIENPDNGLEMKYNEQGEICINSPTLMKKYYNNNEETLKAIDNEKWLHSGDLGHIDKDGCVYIDGRMKRIIVCSGGFKVFPSFVEDTILSSGLVDKCCVVANPHPEFINVPNAHIILKDSLKEQLDENCISEVENKIKKICMEKLPSYSQPYKITFDSEFPLTKAGKIDYLELERRDKEIDIKSIESKSNKIKSLKK